MILFDTPDTFRRKTALAEAAGFELCLVPFADRDLVAKTENG